LGVLGECEMPPEHPIEDGNKISVLIHETLNSRKHGADQMNQIKFVKIIQNIKEKK
jgi:hypothetical protein